MVKFSVSCLLAATLLTSFTPLNIGKIRVEVVGLKNNKGKVLLSLFNKQGAKVFPESVKGAYKSVQLVIEGQKAFATFEQVPHGDYAIALFHDENNNRKIDKNFLGVPQEGYAFSNNYHPLITSPSFKKANFTLNRSSKTLRLKMIY
ncbi:MAG: DUF2141 domain-containing protein [Thermonemataceae bacterium]